MQYFSFYVCLISFHTHLILTGVIKHISYHAVNCINEIVFMGFQISPNVGVKALQRNKPRICVCVVCEYVCVHTERGNKVGGIYFKELAQCHHWAWQVQNLQSSSMGWRPREVLVLQFESKGCLPTECPSLPGYVFFCSGLQLIAWSPPTLWRGICFQQSLISV